MYQKSYKEIFGNKLFAIVFLTHVLRTRIIKKKLCCYYQLRGSRNVKV